jgi:hypothetical protein
MGRSNRLLEGVPDPVECLDAGAVGTNGVAADPHELRGDVGRRSGAECDRRFHVREAGRGRDPVELDEPSLRDDVPVARSRSGDRDSPLRVDHDAEGDELPSSAPESESRRGRIRTRAVREDEDQGK